MARGKLGYENPFYARVAYRYDGRYYLSPDPEDVDKLDYWTVLFTLMDSIPSDSAEFATWKAAKIARLKEVKALYCAEAMTKAAIDNEPGDTARLRRLLRRLDNPKMDYRESVQWEYRASVLEWPYALARDSLERSDRTSGRNSPIDPYIFEVDLDNMCMLLHGYPVFKLQPAMPHPDLIGPMQDAQRTNSYGHPYSFGSAVPEEYRYDIFRDVPSCPVGDDDMGVRVYTQHMPVAILDAHILLGASRTPSTSEACSLAFRCTLIGAFLKYHGPELLRHVVLGGAHRTLHAAEKRLALCLVATALSPSYACQAEEGSGPSWTAGADAAADYWWPRKHICVVLARDLHVSRNCNSGVGRLIDAIMQNNSTPPVTFGVVFSILHCSLVRVCKDVNGILSVACTDPFVFLPDFCGHDPRTPGIEALGRLGYMPAADDVQVFYSILHTVRHALPAPQPPIETTTTATTTATATAALAATASKTPPTTRSSVSTRKPPAGKHPTTTTTATATTKTSSTATPSKARPNTRSVARACKSSAGNPPTMTTTGKTRPNTRSAARARKLSASNHPTMTTTTMTTATTSKTRPNTRSAARARKPSASNYPTQTSAPNLIQVDLTSCSRKSLLHLPAELILSIASYLWHPQELNALAVTSTALMAACLPLVRLPQVIGLPPPFPWERVRPGFILGGHRASSIEKHPHTTAGATTTTTATTVAVATNENDMQTSLFSSTYRSRHWSDGRDVLVSLGPGSMRKTWINVDKENDMRAECSWLRLL